MSPEKRCRFARGATPDFRFVTPPRQRIDRSSQTQSAIDAVLRKRVERRKLKVEEDGRGQRSDDRDQTTASTDLIARTEV